MAEGNPQMSEEKLRAVKQMGRKDLSTVTPGFWSVLVKQNVCTAGLLCSVLAAPGKAFHRKHTSGMLVQRLSLYCPRRILSERRA